MVERTAAHDAPHYLNNNKYTFNMFEQYMILNINTITSCPAARKNVELQSTEESGRHASPEKRRTQAERIEATEEAMYVAAIS